MAYNSGFPMSYQPIYPQYNNYIPQQQVPQQNDNGILWVQGEAGAKSWAVAPGKSVMLMDSESNTFYIKSSDQSGMPMPLRIFDYKERTQQQQQTPVVHQQEIDTSQFVTWDAFNTKLDEMFKTKREEVKNDG